MTKKKTSVIFLQGKRLYLRALEATDRERSKRWINDPDIRQFIMQQYPIDEVGMQKWHEEKNRSNPRTDMIFAIVLHRSNRHIGNMGLHDIDWINRDATTGAIIGEKDCLNKGYGHEAKELVLEYAFMTLGLHRVSSDVLSTNPRSLAYLKRTGYVEEGRKRQAIFRNGKWIDRIMLGIMAEDWFKSQNI